jgi:hypothetical protein
MATRESKNKGRGIRACELIGVSQACYRYQPNLLDQNEQSNLALAGCWPSPVHL